MLTGTPTNGKSLTSTEDDTPDKVASIRVTKPFTVAELETFTKLLFEDVTKDKSDADKLELKEESVSVDSAEV